MDRITQRIRKSMLMYPLIFPTRYAVLRHMFLVYGNGLEWRDGVLDDFDTVRSEDDCRAKFFDGIDQGQGIAHQLERARRQFQLDNLDLLCQVDEHGEARAQHLEECSLQYSDLFCAPDDIEASYKEAMYQLCGSLLQASYLQRDRLVIKRASLIVVQNRLFPERRAMQAELVQAMLKALKT